MRKNLTFLLLWSLTGLLVGLTLYALWSWASDKAPMHHSLQTLATRNSYANGIEQASPAVVSVYASETIYRLNTSTTARATNPRAGNTIAPPERRQSNQGSGVIVDARGFVVTSYHIVRNADQIFVALADGRLFEATVIGDDPETDLAVIQVIAADPLPSRDLTRAPPPRVGDIVLAIGNPYGVGQTVTQGIVSALGRKLAGANSLQNFVQVDAAINPGNSGGALISPEGDLVGINTAVIAPDDGARGIGFAIPAAVVQQVVTQLIENGRVVRGWLGIGVEDLILQPALYRRFTAGVAIVGVIESSPAHRSGLQVGDVVVSANGTRINNAEQLLRLISSLSPGTAITLALQRPQGQDITATTIEAVLAERPRLER